MKLILALMTVAFGSSAFAANLNCKVDRYLAQTGELKACGDFQFNLPKENNYADGTGDCDGFRMYTSWTKSEDGTTYNYSLFVTPDKSKQVADDYTFASFRDAFPARFLIQAFHAGVNYYVKCEVRN